MRFFTETFAAGETKNFAVRGGYFKLFVAQYNVDIKFFSSMGYGQPTRSGSNIPEGFSFTPKDDEFSGVLITSATAQIVTFIIADGDTKLDRISGSVSVVDGGKARTLAGATFMGEANNFPGAANFAHVQLWNPIGSLKNVIVEQLTISNGATVQAPQFKPYGTALTTLYNNANSKKAGGVASGAELRTQANAAALGSANLYFTAWLAANSTQTLKLAEPIVVPPGQGLLVIGGVVNIDIPTTFEFYEEAF